MTKKDGDHIVTPCTKDFSIYRSQKALKNDFASENKIIGPAIMANACSPDLPSRSPSPEKRVAMLRTLRAPRNSQKPSINKRLDISQERPQAAATAATQAWGTQGSFGMINSRDASNYRKFHESGSSFNKEASQHSSYYKAPLQISKSFQGTAKNSGISWKPPGSLQHDRISYCAEGGVNSDVTRKSNNSTDTVSAGKQVMLARQGVRMKVKESETRCKRWSVIDPTNEMGMRAADSQQTISQFLIGPVNDNNYTNTTTEPIARTQEDRRERSSNLSSRFDNKAGEYIIAEQRRNEAENYLDWESRGNQILQSLPSGIDENAAIQILKEVVVLGDKVQWSDIAGLDNAKSTLKEAVVYPFLRPDLFCGLREPARGLLLFGPPGTGKTMLARAVAAESKSTFFSISSSSLTSKFLGDSEKLVRALFAIARKLAPSVIFIDEIDSLLSARSSTGEHEASRRMKTEFLIQWSALARAAAGKEVPSENIAGMGDERVLILAATNLPWMIDAAARRRFSRRQYIPLPEVQVRVEHLRMLLRFQKHDLDDDELELLSRLTEGYSGSDLTELAKDAAMGPLRSVGEKLLEMKKDDIRSIQFVDFQGSLKKIKPSVNIDTLEQYENWAKEYGERGG